MAETEIFFNYLQRVVESAKEDWAKEQFTGSSFDSWALSNAKALGSVQALQNLLQIQTFDEMEQFDE